MIPYGLTSRNLNFCLNDIDSHNCIRCHNITVYITIMGTSQHTLNAILKVIFSNKKKLILVGYWNWLMYLAELIYDW